MNFRQFLVVFLLLSSIDCLAQTIDPYPPGTSPDRIMLNWSDDPATTAAVTWRTNNFIDEAWAEIAVADASPDFQLQKDTIKAVTTFLSTNNNVANFHSVTFDSLTPNTMYAYRVGSEEGFSEWFHFETANDQEAPFSFLYFGDAQNDIKSLWSRCIRQAFISMPDVDFLLHAGDLVNRANSDNEWGEWFYAGGWIYGMKPSIATPGNHEYYGRRNDRQLSTLWQPSFTLPENGPAGLEETVYYVDFQDTRIISLNSMAALSNPVRLSQQSEWLEEILKDNPNRWTIVTQHHPIYSTALGRDNPELRDAFQPLFEKYHVDLVLQGHDHTYGRGHNTDFGKNGKDLGPTYVVSVSGPKMYGLGFNDWLERGANNTQLYQLVSVDGETLNYQAFTVTGELYDHFKLTKNKRNVSEFTDLVTPEMTENLKLPQRAINQMTEEDILKYQKMIENYKARKAGK